MGIPTAIGEKFQRNRSNDGARPGMLGAVGRVEPRGPIDNCLLLANRCTFTLISAVQTLEQQMKRRFLLCSVLAIAACAPQPSTPPVATAPPPVRPGPSLTSPNTFIIVFPWNSRSVSRTGREILQQALVAYRTGAPVTIHVTGYTDRSGSYRDNQRLSTRRVWEVAAMLLRMGVPRDVLVVSGRSENDNRVPTSNGFREPQNRVNVVDDPLLSAAFSPGGSRHSARVRDGATAKEIAALRGQEGLVWSAALSPDGSRIVTTSGDNTARIWDAKTGTVIALLRGHEGLVWSAAFSPDGSRIVTTSWDNTARIWDAATAKEIVVLRGHDNLVLSAAFSPDGLRMVTASYDETARIWDIPTGKEIAVLRGHQGLVWSAVFSPDGSRIVTASDDKTARLWDVATRTEIAVLVGHEEGVISAVFSPDGSRIVTVSGDNTAGIWDAATAKETAVLRGHEGSVFSAAFSPDGSRIVTVSDDETARIWDAGTGKEIAVQAVEPAPQ
jgi:dipeptidyl aminopeptidase/acylaminoacyl peptidase